MAQPINAKSKPSRIIISAALTLLTCYIVLSALAFFFSEKLIFPYKDRSYGASLPGLMILEAQDATPIAARYWENPASNTLVILFHGNYEDLGQLDHIAATILDTGFSVLAMDYRGYGLSKGTPTENNCYSDGRMIIHKAHSLGFDESRIILWGRSVGSGIATQLATEINARALVLESPFITAFRTMTHIPLLPFDKFNNLKKIALVRAPLFIMHGTHDDVIPSWHSTRLMDRHRYTKTLHLIDGAGHNNLWSKDLEPAFSKLARILDGYSSSPSRLPGTR